MNEFNNLHVIHRLKDASGSGMAETKAVSLQTHGLYINTCLRELLVTTSAHAHVGDRIDAQCQHLQGKAAYTFLLQTIAGLNSSIPGETNIQGQIRKSWDNWRRHANSGLVISLNAVMHSLFADVRHIRRSYLQGIGGNSYGSLVRKLLNPGADANILFVGAGEFAHSMYSFFNTYNTAIWNRHAIDLPGAAIQHYFAPDDSHQAAEWATHVIVTTPADTANDALWAELLLPGQKTLVHLGRRHASRGVWSQHAHFFDLDDVFELRRSQSSLRSLQLQRARRACGDCAAHQFNAASVKALAPLARSA